MPERQLDLPLAGPATNSYPVRAPPNVYRIGGARTS